MEPKKRIRKRSYIPSIITLMNLGCGFMAIVTADYYKSSIFLLFSLVFDVLDGFAARKLQAQSELADLTSFGVAPAYLYFLLSPVEGWAAMIPPLAIVVASAVRLAKFNLLPPSPYFSGLPTPATAMFLIGLFLGIEYDSQIIKSILENVYAYWAIAFFFAFIMVSTVRMFSLKGLNKDMRQNKLQLVLLIVFIILLLVDNKLAAPVIILLYIILSLAQSLSRKA